MTGTAPPSKEEIAQDPRKPKDPDGNPRRNPPGSIPDILPGIDPEQTPGIDHLPAEME